jgi:gluconolactonase
LTVDCSHIGRAVTNLAFGGDDQRDLFITVSDTNTVARARMPVPGRPMYSHA